MTYDLILQEVFPMATIKEVLDRNFKDVQFDRDLCKRIIDFTISFMNRNADHSAFFGGVLLGVQQVRFFDTDREIWYDDVLRIDEALLVQDFKSVEFIDPNHRVMSDVFNHLPAYICSRLLKTTNVPLNIRHEAMVSCFMVLHFKYLTSLLVPRFKYPARKEVAEAAFAALNYRFDIKTIGSWEKLFRQRAEGIIAPDSIYAPFLTGKTQELDYWSGRVVSDTQTRLRELINKYYDVYIRTLQSGGKLVISSDMAVNSDGEQILRDKSTGYRSYLTYIHQVAQQEQNFIRPELVGIIEKIMPTMPPEMFMATLRHLSRNIGQPRAQKLEKLVDECLLYAFDYMQSLRTMVARNNDLQTLLVKIRAKIMASKTENAQVIFMREEGEKLVRDATNSRVPAYIAATRTGLMLYLILRAMTKNYYTKTK